MTFRCAKGRVPLCGSLAAVALLAVISSPASAGVIALDTISLDSGSDTFTDPSSGIVFSNPSSPASNAFVIEQADENDSLPNMTPGDILTGNGTADSTTDYDFSFTISFPSPVTQLNMDMAYVVDPIAGGSIELDGFDADGNFLASETENFQTAGLQEFDLSFSSAVGVSSVNVVPTAIAEGFGNISDQTQNIGNQSDSAAVPEPVSLLSIVGGCVLLRRRGRSQSTSVARG